jgi:LmbE family N-acetylglucosaminyl deacetylase
VTLFAVLLVSTFVYFVVALIVSRKSSLFAPPRDLLICAAHSDDCVIMGAEMAYGALKSGNSVHIVFLTCSGEAPGTKIAKQRAEEAIAAWGSVNVPRENIKFVNLPSSELGGVRQYSDAEIVLASDVIETKINALSKGGCVIVPAEDEEHIDHEAVRQATILAENRIERPDLVFYETPEYNSHLSMAQDPLKAVERLIRSVPFVSKLMTEEKVFAGFPYGSAGSVFRDTPKRLELKSSMFDYFGSQDPELLRKYFAVQTRYRKINNIRKTGILRNRRYFSLLSRKSDLSVVVFLTLILTTAGAASFAISECFVDAFAGWSLVLAALLTATTLLSAVKKRLVFALLVSSVLTGFLAGSL